MQTTINNQAVEINIIENTATNHTEIAPTTRELLMLNAIDTALKNNSAFSEAYPNAQLIRADSMRAFAENKQGRYYLRYKADNGMVEFWGCEGKRFKINLSRGLVVVVNH